MPCPQQVCGVHRPAEVFCFLLFLLHAMRAQCTGWPLWVMLRHILPLLRHQYMSGGLTEACQLNPSQTLCKTHSVVSRGPLQGLLSAAIYAPCTSCHAGWVLWSWDPSHCHLVKRSTHVAAADQNCLNILQPPGLRYRLPSACIDPHCKPPPKF